MIRLSRISDGVPSDDAQWNDLAGMLSRFAARETTLSARAVVDRMAGDAAWPRLGGHERMAVAASAVMCSCFGVGSPMGRRGWHPSARADRSGRMSRIAMWDGLLGGHSDEVDLVSSLVSMVELPMSDFASQHDVVVASLRTQRLSTLALLSRHVYGSSSARFEDACEASGCLDSPASFPDPDARLSYCRDRSANFPCQPGRDLSSAPTMVVMCGLPSSGKTRWVEKNMGHMPVVDYDEEASALGDLSWRNPATKAAVAEECEDMGTDLVSHGRSFCVEWINLGRDDRRKWVDMAVAAGMSTRIVYVDTDIEIMVRRGRRTMIPHIDKPMTVRGLRHYYRALDAPDLSECHELVRVGARH